MRAKRRLAAMAVGVFLLVELTAGCARCRHSCDTTCETGCKTKWCGFPRLALASRTVYEDPPPPRFHPVPTRPVFFPLPLDGALSYSLEPLPEDEVELIPAEPPRRPVDPDETESPSR